MPSSTARKADIASSLSTFDEPTDWTLQLPSVAADENGVLTYTAGNPVRFFRRAGLHWLSRSVCFPPAYASRFQRQRTRRAITSRCPLPWESVSSKQHYWQVDRTSPRVRSPSTAPSVMHPVIGLHAVEVPETAPSVGFSLICVCPRVMARHAARLVRCHRRRTRLRCLALLGTVTRVELGPNHQHRRAPRHRVSRDRDSCRPQGSFTVGRIHGHPS